MPEWQTMNVLLFLLHPSNHPFTYPPIYPFTHPSIYPFTHPPTHPLIHPSIHPHTHPPTHPSTHPSTHSCIHPATHPPTHPSIHPTKKHQLSTKPCGRCWGQMSETIFGCKEFALYWGRQTGRVNIQCSASL